MSAVARLRGVAKRYSPRGRWVLTGVGLDVPSGALVAVRGPNGAGKSTLLRIVAGASAPTRGRRDGPRAGYAPDGLEPAPALTAATYLRGHARVRGADPHEARCLIERLGLDPGLLGEPVGALSRGARQKVVLAQALLGSPALLVLDEPSAALDDCGSHALGDLVRERAAAGTAVVFSAHDEALGCDAVWRVEAGGVAT